ncbi:nuclear transport factor 2 family protein [Nocardia sp. NPDC004582]
MSGSLHDAEDLVQEVLILRDVLALRAAEVAGLLDTSAAAVNSALQRAHAQLTDLEPGPVELGDEDQPELLERYVSAFETMDVEALKAVLREDALLQMPPFEAWFLGRDAVTAFLARVFARGEAFRLLPTRANGRPALGAYVRRTPGAVFEPANLHVLTLDRAGVARMDLFHAPALFPAFGLPTGL